MKRTSKEKNRSLPNTDLTRVVPWAAWFWLANWSKSESIKSDFPKDFSDLNWVRQQLDRVVEVVEVDRELRSGSSDKSEESTTVQSSRLRPTWASMNPPTPPSLVVLASANRSDPIEEALNDLSKRYPDATIRLLLGEWWAGHRRTWQFSSDVTRVYWHQCHDVLLPDAMELVDVSAEPATQVRQALVVSDDSSIRQMWLEVLPTLGFQALAARDMNGLPEGMVDVVVLDQDRSEVQPEDRSPDDHGEAFCDVASQVSIARRVFPQAKIVVCFGFPRWTEMHRCIEAGAELFLGKPFDLQGFGRLLRSKLAPTE